MSKKAWFPTCVIFALAMAHEAANSQPLHTAERVFLEILLRDTTSRTVCNLQGSFFFGLNDRWFGYLVLVKNGKRNLFIREATGQVYQLRKTSQGPMLQRIDSSLQIGDNFMPIVFERKDTIYQLGGYGFWRKRDFFTRYDRVKGDWEFMPSERAIPVEYRMHHYDAEEDALYMTDATLMDRDIHEPTPYTDSIYRYRFKDRSWHSIGVLRKEHIDMVKVRFWIDNKLFSQTPFGIFCINQGHVLFDFKGNRVLKGRNQLKDRIKPIQKLQLSCDMYRSVFIYMGDSLHAVITKPNNSVEYKAIPLSINDFDEDTAVPLYDATDTYSDSPIGRNWTLSLSVALATLLFVLWRRNIAAPLKKPPAEIEGMHSIETEPLPDKQSVLEIGTSLKEYDFQQKAVRFLNSLSPSERELLRSIFQLTLQGKFMDIDTFNRSIGVATKEDGVKKTRRSLVISRINDAFSLTMQESTDLLNRSPDPEDRRSNRYQVAAEHLSTLRSIFDTMAP